MAEKGIVECCEKRNTLVSYEDASSFFTLDQSERMIDEMLLSSSHNAVEKYTLHNFRTEYTKETVPDDIRECILKEFMYKKNLMKCHCQGVISDDENIRKNEMLPKEIKDILDGYRKVTI